MKNLSLSSDPSSSFEDLKDLFEIVAEGKRIWEATFDAIVDPVMIVSQDFKIQRANLAAAKSAQVNVRELIGKPCYQVFAKREKPCQLCPMQLGLEENHPSRERLNPFPDQREFVASTFPIAQQLGMAVMQYQDVSAIRRLEEQLVQSEKMAALGLFASGIAHDINNPLSGVLAFAQLAMEGLDQNSQTYRDIQEIEASALRCKKIVEDILQFVRPSFREEKSRHDLGEIALRVLPSLQVQWKDFDYELKLEIQKLTPVSLIPSKLEQVFTNIIANAFQALSPGGHLTLRSGEDEKTVFVEIQDNGEGISEENLKKIFDPYFTTKSKIGGTGLGLPICYNIVREHGGRIEVKSQIGQGSSFKIFLPKGGYA